MSRAPGPEQGEEMLRAIAALRPPEGMEKRLLRHVLQQAEATRGRRRLSRDYEWMRAAAAATVLAVVAAGGLEWTRSARQPGTPAAPVEFVTPSVSQATHVEVRSEVAHLGAEHRLRVHAFPPHVIEGRLLPNLLAPRGGGEPAGVHEGVAVISNDSGIGVNTLLSMGAGVPGQALSALPVSAPGRPLPTLVASAPGHPLPTFDIATVPGHPLPSFADAIQTGEQP